jgi:glutamate synthase domain-containing protein 3
LEPELIEFDLAEASIRDLNSRLHKLPPDTNERAWRIVNPRGAHSVAVGLTQPIEVRIEGHVGYYCAGMNKEATVVIDGQCGWGLAENIRGSRRPGAAAWWWSRAMPAHAAASR